MVVVYYIHLNSCGWENLTSFLKGLIVCILNFTDVMVLNDIIEQAAGRTSQLSHASVAEEPQERLPFKQMMRAKMIALAYKCLGKQLIKFTLLQKIKKHTII